MFHRAASVNKIWIVLTVILVVLGFAIFGSYAYYLPKISNDHAAWSSFGSLLSGFFTLGGVIATLATLLFLNAQNKNQQHFIEWQIQALTFEQYINHRKLFIERLGELQTVCGNQIRFNNPEILYNSLFPKNLPTKLFLTVEPDRSDESQNLLGRLSYMFEKLETNLDKAQWDDNTSRQFVYDLIMLKDSLQIDWIGEDSDGDILVEGKNIGANIYSLNEFCSRSKIIFNSFLYYTGNPEFKGFMKGNPRYIREALIQCFSRPWKDWPITTVKNISGLSSLEHLLFLTDSMRDETHNWVLPITYRELERVFSSRNDVLKLQNRRELLRLVDKCNNEVEWALSLMEKHDTSRDHLANLLTCAEILDALKSLFAAENQPYISP